MMRELRSGFPCGRPPNPFVEITCKCGCSAKFTPQSRLQKYFTMGCQMRAKKAGDKRNYDRAAAKKRGMA